MQEALAGFDERICRDLQGEKPLLNLLHIGVHIFASQGGGKGDLEGIVCLIHGAIAKGCYEFIFCHVCGVSFYDEQSLGYVYGVCY
jgi:hypothetical protein